MSQDQERIAAALNARPRISDERLESLIVGGRLDTPADQWHSHPSSIDLAILDLRDARRQRDTAIRERDEARRAVKVLREALQAYELPHSEALAATASQAVNESEATG